MNIYDCKSKTDSVINVWSYHHTKHKLPPVITVVPVWTKERPFNFYKLNEAGIAQ